MREYERIAGGPTSTHINIFTRRCQTCQVNARKRTKFHFSSWWYTRYFLERVHVDIGHWQDNRFLVLVDSYSKWIDVHLLKDLTASASICALRRAIKYVGLPTIIVSDKGTNFASEEFRRLCLENFIQQTYTPPGHHASNGLVERAIQDFKLYMNKCKTELRTGLERLVINFCLSRNSTPAANGSVPADFVFQKALRTRLSVTCTERDTPTEPRPVFIRVENRRPAEGEIIAKYGRNTQVDSRNRLVHDADVTPRVPDEAVPEVPEPDSTPHSYPAPPTPAPRRSGRVRREPERWSYS